MAAIDASGQFVAAIDASGQFVAAIGAGGRELSQTEQALHSEKEPGAADSAHQNGDLHTVGH